MIMVSDDSRDYTEQARLIIVHSTKSRKPVLLETMDASDFFGRCHNNSYEVGRRTVC